MKKKLKPITAYGILNAYGDWWTWKTFETAHDAVHYMNIYWENIIPRPNMDNHKIIKVRITVINPTR